MKLKLLSSLLISASVLASGTALAHAIPLNMEAKPGATAPKKAKKVKKVAAPSDSMKTGDVLMTKDSAAPAAK
jgi:hypothetical protein